ncbi:MAG TPA: hypothetical protein VFV26_03515, partial [Geothrix sp.]|nr:hypothetical protein [Geothrix sp.]
MRLGPLQQHFRERLRKRTPWAAVLAFAALFTALQFMLVPASVQVRHPGALANVLLMPLMVSFCYGFLSPLPWRWTGDDRLRAPLARGLVQALAFNALVIAVLVGLSWFMVRNASLKAEAMGLAPGAKGTFGGILLVNLMV